MEKKIKAVILTLAFFGIVALLIVLVLFFPRTMGGISLAAGGTALFIGLYKMFLNSL
jgi:hypothetical protein